ncbi:MAG: 2-succinyl-5-enolpyruvyl-6-hydroxy-3-cyclohexene-1-carboxylic-acid synthase [Tenacibaculum sp.]|nr:2-succinyl-5-enolpyruvyl-6-hydroxy-3-cyclohexene-1-carboxylic-acid synthase [Tenacibaculum sp.]
MKILAKQVISVCEYFGIDKIVISPGSRNAPLTIGFSKNKNFETFSIVDERCAGFFALGMAQQTQKPVALVCTSGSALLNYYPAIAEAFYSNIPLVVISADRPKHLIDIGDGQTIRQENVYQNHISYSANLDEKDFEKNTKLLVEALLIAEHKKSPVHINVPFDEPLYEESLKVEKLENYNVIVNEIIQSQSEKRKEEKLVSLFIPNEVDYQKTSKIWNNSQKKLILVGVNYPSEELQEFLNDLVEKDNSVLVMTETTSNLYNDKFINSIDKLITSFDEEKIREFQPDLLVTLGGFVVSKRIKQFLRKYQSKHHWHVDFYTKLDTYFCLTEYFKIKPELFFKNLIKIIEFKKVKNSYQQKFIEEKTKRNQKHKEFLKQTKYSDLKVVEQVLQSIPDNCQLQISNSSMIRYVQLFDVNNTFQVFCNRGTSGIDGSTSTAIGASFTNEKQTVFLTGDISFFYDSNALWNNYIPKNFRIILVNNDGGGIFKIISGSSNSGALPFFETKHGLTAENLAKMFNFEYCSARNLEEVNQNLNDFYLVSDRPKILEIFTPSDLNDKVLKEYFKAMNN